MKAIVINRSDIQGKFIVPPECGGQMVTHSYACTEDYILHASGGTITAHRWPARGNFEPQNCAPKLGRQVGTVTIREDVV